MEFFYPFLIAFIMVFIAELGDKTQLLVLSFAGGVKTRQILFGIAIGSFFSHGIAIMFGSRLGIIGNETFIAAGSTITEDVPDYALAIARGRQVNKEDWNKK